MNEHSTAWMPIAAKIINEKGVSLSSTSTADEVKAASFIFDRGILCLPEENRMQVRDMLLAEAAKIERSK